MRDALKIGSERPRAGLVLAGFLGLAVAGWAPAWGAVGPVNTLPAVPAIGQDEDLEEWLAAERGEAQRLIEGRAFSEAKRLLDEHLDEDGDDWRARALRGRLELARARYAKARRDLERAFQGATGERAPDAADLPGSHARAGLVLDLAELELALGHAPAALAHLDAGGTLDAPLGARGDVLRGRALLALGDRGAAREAFRCPNFMGEGLQPVDVRGDVEFLNRARGERALGQVSAASYSLVTADKLAEGRSADVLAELASLYFEVDGEVALAASAARRPADLYREALELAPGHPAALLGMYALHDLNWRRSSRSARSWLVELLEDEPEHVAGRVALAGDQLQNGEFKGARATLDGLLADAGGRRDVVALEAAFAWITDEVAPAEAQLAALAEVAPWDSAPERLIGQTLIDLYRFGDALAFLESAVARDPGDWRAWTALGEARANTGDEAAALEALHKAEDVAAGRQDAWRNNVRLVLERMADRWIEVEGKGRLTYALPPEGHELLERVLAPFYFESRADLAARYGLTPGDVRIEVFDRHADFSVRSTGFEGFPALGVCFGPVVTALSPLSEMRGNFSWAETSYHEFSHVVHLGLTRNRCPRWITEGLATWEEERQDPSWTRNMRRELVDNLNTGALIGVRDLNRAFRGPRIIWAYYQGGLMCEMLIDDFGFPAMVEFLEAFDAGLELDAALERAYRMTPEELDAAFLAFVEAYVAELHVEPRHDPAAMKLRAYTLAEEPPGDGLEAWAAAWCDVAWAAFQDGREVDAEGALRHLTLAGVEPPRAAFLRGAIALARKDEAGARAAFDRGFEAGGRDFIATMLRAQLAEQAGESDAALALYARAEADFPGWAEASFSAELAQARLFDALGRTDDAMLARERRVRWDSGDGATRMQVGNWRLARGLDTGDRADLERALDHFTGAIEVDPFIVAAHRGRGRALVGLTRFAEAAEAYELALLVPLELDPEWGQASDEARANLTAELEAERAEAEAEAEQAGS